MNKTIGLLLMPLEYVTDGQRYGMIVERIQRYCSIQQGLQICLRHHSNGLFE